MMRLVTSCAVLVLVASCGQKVDLSAIEIYQTSSSGDQCRKLAAFDDAMTTDTIEVLPEQRFQTITGFGGAFTESSAVLYSKLSVEMQAQFMAAYFSEDGARYTLCRTHMNSCDFSLRSYAYVNDHDTALVSFSVKEDEGDLIPMIKAAQKVSRQGFKLIASPWTAPPWMKTNQAWFAGSLNPEFYETWAVYFTKYLDAYMANGIDIWGFTIENEPLGNDSNWESMHFSPSSMASFVTDHLGPALAKGGYPQKLLIYDQNRGRELEEWADVMLRDERLLPYIYGTAVHWYTGTVDWFPTSLQYTHDLAPDKHLIHTEGCVDSEAPHWHDDQWYWQREATDWGWDWAKPEDKKDHPKYVPVYRYARDMIGCLNNWVEGWIDWNMLLDRQGGPNHVKNWCIAPVLMDTNAGELYYTPLYYTMKQFSRYIDPGAVRIGWRSTGDDNLLCTALQNPDGSRVIVVLNQGDEPKTLRIVVGETTFVSNMAAQAIQTIRIQPHS